MNRKSNSHPEGPRETEFYDLFKETNRLVRTLYERMDAKGLSPAGLQEEVLFIRRLRKSVTRLKPKSLALRCLAHLDAEYAWLEGMAEGLETSQTDNGPEKSPPRAAH